MTTEAVTGMLQKIIFSNDRGFLIGSFADDAGKPVKEFVALGSMLRPEPGMRYTLRGRWIDHHQFGRQLQFSGYEVEKPKSASGIFKYLVRVTKWVGPAIGEAMVEKYGADTLEVLKADPQRVAKDIKGITDARALEIQQKLLENEYLEAALVELEELLAVPGIKKSLPMDLINKYGSDAPQRLKENPYILTEFKSVGFKSADLVAIMKIGCDRDSIFRKMAAGLYVLKNEMQTSGSVWIRREWVENEMRELLQVGEVGSGIDKLVELEEVGVEGGWITTMKKAKSEALIAHRVCLLLVTGETRTPTGV